MTRNFAKTATAVVLLTIAGSASASVISSEQAVRHYASNHSWSGYSNPYQGQGLLQGNFSIRWLLQYIKGPVKQPVSVPEPTTLALLGAGLLGMGLAARRRKAA